jgi:homoserine O-acetyltransferase
MAVARRWVQKQILGLVGEGADGARAVAVARALAMTTYRSPAEFRERFSGPGGRQSLESYLEHQGRKFAERFDRESALRLMDSIDAHDVDPAAIGAPLSLLGFDSDELCPPALLEELAARAPRAGTPRIIRTRYGHDAFLCEAEPVAAAIRDFLQGDQP